MAFSFQKPIHSYYIYIHGSLLNKRAHGLKKFILKGCLVQEIMLDLLKNLFQKVLNTFYKLCYYLPSSTKFYLFWISIKEYILKLLFGEMYFFKKEEYTISFNNIPLLTFSNVNPKPFYYLWCFIYSSCHFYTMNKKFELSSYQKEEIIKFFEQFPIVSKEEYFDKENNDTIFLYQNYFKNDPKGQQLRKEIRKFSTFINYPSFVLEVIKLYSTMLQTYGDPELDLIPKKKDRLAIMNVDLSHFISTRQELEIFIEALELEFQDVIYSQSLYSSYIERLIRSLKLSLNNFKDSSSKSNSDVLSIILFIISPLGFYTLFNQVNKFLPFILIYLFGIWFIYYCYKFLLPYLETRQICLGLLNLNKQIFKYIWSQKIMFLLLLLIPNFNLMFSCYNCFLNFLTISSFNLSSPFINYMLQTSHQYKKKVFKSFIDVAASLKLIQLNPILKPENLFKQEGEKLASSLIYRSWYRFPTFFRKYYGKALEWTIQQNKILAPHSSQTKTEFYEKIANIQSKPFKNHPLFSDMANILTRDQGHMSVIRNDEAIIALMVGEQLNCPVFHVPNNINGFAVDFRVFSKETGLELFFEVKPGYNICREKLSHAWSLMLKQLKEEEMNTQLGTRIGLVFECSEVPYEKMLQLREIIRNNNFQSRIILTHKIEASNIQNVILENSSLLVQSDIQTQRFTDV
jgi:hypothetical protein